MDTSATACPPSQIIIIDTLMEKRYIWYYADIREYGEIAASNGQQIKHKATYT